MCTQVGNGLNPIESRTHFAAFAITSSPLVLGFDLTNTSQCESVELDTATCIIIAPKRLKLRLSGSARKSQKRFRDTPRFKFQAVLARTQPFLSHSVEKRGDQSRFKCRKWSITLQFAVGVRLRNEEEQHARA
eukprot:COSAG06_NODE_7877_length_2345_cov_9.581923_3_plen_133_part_00